MGIGDLVSRFFQANIADGTRAAMRRAYRTSARRARRRGDPSAIKDTLPDGASDDPAHVVGLFEALASRYAASGVSRQEIEHRTASGYLWIELMPFLFLDQEDAVEALAEYVLWKEADEALLEYMLQGAEGPYPEWTSSVRQDWLQARVLESVRRMEAADPPIAWLEQAREDAAKLGDGDSPSIPWLVFLRDDSPSDAAAAFEQAAGWTRVPATVLSALSERLENAWDAEWFISVAERSGIYERMLQWDNAGGENATYGLVRIAEMLTGYANGLGDRGDMIGAKGALRLALMLNPNHVPAWASMAIVHMNTGDCEEATRWAQRVLGCDPAKAEGPVGLLGGGMAGVPTSGDRDFAAALGDHALEGAWQGVKESMEGIIEQCEGRTP